MKAYILAIFALSTTGCFAAQRDAINEEADTRLYHLDRQCRSNMTEWCRTQYSIVQQNRTQELNDLEARRHHAAQVWADSFSRPTVQCTSNEVGGYVYTTCR